MRVWAGLLFALLLAVGPARAAEVPHLTRHVTDLTGTLAPAEIERLDGQLVQLERSKGAQLVVLMVGTTAPQDIEEYSLAVAEANKVGRKGPDDGVLLLVAKDDRRVRIEVGYGLEGAIPDAASARIIREYIAPRFREGDYAGGIRDAVQALTGLIQGEPLPPPVEGAPRHRGSHAPWLFIAFVVAVILRGWFGRSPLLVRAPLGALVTGGLLWFIAASLGAALLGGLIGGLFMLLPGGAGRTIGHGRWGGWGGFGGGGFGGGGFGGGGWRGGGGFGGGGGGGFSGGGGSFGGGGASGSW